MFNDREDRMTESQEHLDELIERGCCAWWEAERDGKRVANCSWAEANENWKGDYRMRMKSAILALGVWP
jgi:hypothetical protein